MIRSIRRLSVVVLLLFLAMLANATYLQYFQAADIRASFREDDWEKVETKSSTWWKLTLNPYDFDVDLDYSPIELTIFLD